MSTDTTDRLPWDGLPWEDPLRISFNEVKNYVSSAYGAILHAQNGPLSPVSSDGTRISCSLKAHLPLSGGSKMHVNSTMVLPSDTPGVHMKTNHRAWQCTPNVKVVDVGVPAEVFKLLCEALAVHKLLIDNSNGMRENVSSLTGSYECCARVASVHGIPRNRAVRAVMTV